MSNSENKQKCTINGCNLYVYKEHQQCVLHCSKTNSDQNLINDFIEELKLYIQHSQQLPTELNFVTEDIHFPKKSNSLINNNYFDLYNKYGKLEFINCHFYIDQVDINLTIPVIFSECHFYDDWTLNNYTNCEQNAIYEKCSFKKNIYASDKDLSYHQFNKCFFTEDIYFENITFKQNIEIIQEENISLSTSLSIIECTFEKNFEIININQFNKHNSFKKLDLSNSSFKKEFKIEKCNIEDKIEINECNFDEISFLENNINILKINNSIINEAKLRKITFNDKFEFKNNEINENLIINDCNFIGIADFHGTEVQKTTNVEKCNFEAITVFDKCEFNDFIKLEYVTFKDSAIFRNTKFYNGVDLSKSNFNYVAGANFLGCEIEDNKKEKGTNRETFRVIKHCFDSIGNHLEANKFFAEEMKAKKRELMEPLNSLQKFLFNDILFILLFILMFSISLVTPEHGVTKTISVIYLYSYIYILPFRLINNLKKEKLEIDKPRYFDLIVFLFNEKISNFGQSYIKPIIIFLISSFLFYSLKSFPFPDFINNIFANIPYLTKSACDKSAFISFVFYVWFAILIWQIIVAFKRHTRR
ncbi:hypothetical protein [Francisella sp. LA112445]|uniref:hypothetical protein n=1 Tax=Francisella sp. LA112445 TaxID=1395624 RepID=UPI001788C752|nr:hypothetical protein [Francisella sp. LA112445]QIW09913.1 hypothetical protein FIP56_04155 [Francisella sp. LA112445]